MGAGGPSSRAAAASRTRAHGPTPPTLLLYTPGNTAQVIFVAGARTVFTGDLLRVEDRGVMNVVKAMQVCGG